MRIFDETKTRVIPCYDIEKGTIIPDTIIDDEGNEEKIFRFVPYTATELVDLQREELRQRRSTECFPIINRGALWYEKLTSDQRSELSEWYEKWLDAPQTLSAPTAPSWIDEKVNE